jgi:hypothetical protein
MTHYETASMSGRKPIALAHKPNPTSGTRVTNARAWARLRKHELDARIETLNRNIEFHKHNLDRDRGLNHLVIAWRRELMEAKLERAGLGV